MFTIKNNNYAMATLDYWCVMVKIPAQVQKHVNAERKKNFNAAKAQKAKSNGN